MSEKQNLQESEGKKGVMLAHASKEVGASSVGGTYNGISSIRNDGGDGDHAAEHGKDERQSESEFSSEAPAQAYRRGLSTTTTTITIAISISSNRSDSRVGDRTALTARAGTSATRSVFIERLH
jgi:hypothetical protein